jgi:hypothetical protein
MTPLRLVLGAVAAVNAVTGVQAVVAPRGFFDGYPLGRGWVAEAAPYNEHLVVDVGGFYLALAVLFAWAAARPDRRLVVPLVTAWTAFSLLHLGYHVTHLDGFGPLDGVVQTLGLIGVLAPAALVAWQGSRSGLEHPMSPASVP